MIRGFLYAWTPGVRSETHAALELYVGYLPGLEPTIATAGGFTLRLLLDDQGVGGALTLTAEAWEARGDLAGGAWR